MSVGRRRGRFQTWIPYKSRHFAGLFTADPEHCLCSLKFESFQCDQIFSSRFSFVQCLVHLPVLPKCSKLNKDLTKIYRGSCWLYECGEDEGEGGGSIYAKQCNSVVSSWQYFPTGCWIANSGGRPRPWHPCVNSCLHLQGNHCFWELTLDLYYTYSSSANSTK